MTKPLLLIGAGGHAKTVLDAALASGRTVLGLVDVDPKKIGQKIFSIPILNQTEALQNYRPDDVELVIAIGSIGDAHMREKMVHQFKALGYDFARVIHPHAIIGSDTSIGAGTVVLAGAIIQSSCNIAEHVILNTGSQMDHDCIIGSFTHLAPGAVLCGSVHLEDHVHIGPNATVIQGKNITRGCLIPSGTIVKNDIHNI
ncbi:acetyltransferase [Terasakiella sp. A23]|uniref:acetyltransferase n=1 Tax=Terasakiella sp. FCG-A23 TaxID=3080561 RepID=UPI002952F365|nr:acetyltransferase [Terasakiella sp. A23]MDV7339791.1 acetyltransferase [Terasakiella sp. A23]